MNKQFQWILCAGLALNSSPAQLNAEDILVQTRLMRYQEFDQTGTVQTYNLRDFFQKFEEPGPKVTVTMSTPIFDEMRELFYGIKTDEFGNWLYEGSGDDKRLLTENVEGQVWSYATYQTIDGLPYDNLFQAYPEDFKYQDYTFDIQLYPEDARYSVANFLTYANSDEAETSYNGTVSHRMARGPDFTGVNAIFAGTHYYKELENSLGAAVPLKIKFTVPFEEGLEPQKGNIAIYRADSAATSINREWFINVTENTAFNSSFTSFARILNYEENEEFFKNLVQTPLYNFMYTSTGSSYFNAYPRFSWFPNDPDSHVIFDQFTPKSGSTDGISYSWKIVVPGENEEEDEDEEEEEETDPNHFPQSFNISLDNNDILHIEVVDTGYITINISATDGTEEGKLEFNTILESYNPQMLSDANFGFSKFEDNRMYESPWFGWVRDVPGYPEFYHENHGLIQQYGAHKNLFRDDEGDPLTGIQISYLDWMLGLVYIYKPLYPWIYAADHGLWLYYAKGTGEFDLGDAENPPSAKVGRWFYDPTLPEEENHGWFVDFQRFGSAE